MNTVSFVIPILNSQNTLDKCLNSIRQLDYPQNKINIIIIDGGSTDRSLDIAKKYNCKVYQNHLKTAESGKAIGLKKSTGDYIAFIDSDNIIPNKNWLKKMLLPFNKNTEIVGSEPWAFSYRKKAGFIERYSSLFGANDPYAYICGLSDRINYIDKKWTHTKINQKEYKDYVIVKLESKSIIPTIGANGTIFKASFLKKQNISNYLFDIDIIKTYLDKHQYLYFAKIKTGIIHTFCESSIQKFIRKQNRRLIDLYTYQDLRKFNWSKLNNICIPKFIIYTILFFPALIDSLRGYLNKPDIAWFFHPIACILTLTSYTIITIKKHFGLLKPQNRQKWQQ